MRENIKSILFRLWIALSTIIVLCSTAFIFIYIIKNGASSMSFEFIFDKPKGMPLGSEGGIFPAIVGSLLLTLIACIFAAILAISTAIYVVFYCKSKRIEGLIHVIVQCMTGVPSIVLGLFGYTLLVVNLKLGRSLLSGGITLGIMIFPFIQVRVEKTLREISSSLINSSHALGVSKSYLIFKLVLPICKSDIISATTLAGGFAMGAAAPIILTAAVIYAPVPESLFSPVMALPFHLYILTGEGISLEKSYATALILILLLFMTSILSLSISFLTNDRKYNKNM